MTEKQQPINLSLPNTSKQKMIAIVNLSEAVRDVARALVSVQTNVTIAHNDFHDLGTAINVDLEEDIVDEQNVPVK